MLRMSTTWELRPWEMGKVACLGKGKQGNLVCSEEPVGSLQILDIVYMI